MHGHTRQQARAMAEQIRKNAFQKSVTELGPNVSVIGRDKKPAQSSVFASSSTTTKSDNAQQGLADFIMHRCKGCNKLFEKKDSHDRHARMCAQAKAVVAMETKIKTEPTEAKIKTEPQVTESNTNGSTSSSSSVSSGLNQMVSNAEISAEEMKSILEIIDESTHQCLKCYRMFGTTSNLHRHAIRHLGK